MWVDVQQNTEEWLNLRLGKATSSNFGKIMANYGKSFGEPAKKYAQQIALEIVTGKRDERSKYSNQYMDDGHDLEPLAIDLYEAETFTEVTNGGFFCTEIYGDSPDGNVGEKGCIEVKSVIANTHWERLKKGSYDTSYKWQIQGHIWLGKKDWCDFISYCPEMPENKQLYIYRVIRDEEMISKLQERLSEFWRMVKSNVELLMN